jgi:hypothetical protein
MREDDFEPFELSRSRETEDRLRLAECIDDRVRELLPALGLDGDEDEEVLRSIVSGDPDIGDCTALDRARDMLAELAEEMLS